MGLSAGELDLIRRHNQRVKDIGGGQVTITWGKGTSGNCEILKVIIAAEHIPEDIYEPRAETVPGGT